MADKINPPTKPVGKADGVNKTNSNITTPQFDDANGNKNWSGGEKKGTIFGKK